LVAQGSQAVGTQGFSIGQKSLQALEVQFPLVPQPQQVCPAGHCVAVIQGSQAIGIGIGVGSQTIKHSKRQES